MQRKSETGKVPGYRETGKALEQPRGDSPPRPSNADILRQQQRFEWSSKGGKVGGLVNAKEGLGIHGATPQQRFEWTSKGGKVGGRRVVTERLGIHRFTLEELRAAQKRSVDVRMQKQYVSATYDAMREAQAKPEAKRPRTSKVEVHPNKNETAPESDSKN